MTPETTPERQPLARRRFLTISAVAVLLGMLSGITACGPEKPLRIASQVWPGYGFLYLARQQGLFAKDAIQLLETGTLADSSAALVAGEVDGAALTLDETLHLLDKGISLKVVLILDISAGADAVMARPKIKSIEQLKNRSIGVEPSTLGTIMYSELLAASRLQANDANKVVIGFDHLQAWENSELDAIITYAPNIQQFEKRGLVNLFDSRQTPGRVVDVLAIRTEALHQHTNAISQLVSGHFQALYLWQTNPFDTSFSLAKLFGLQQTEVHDAFKGMDLPDIGFNRHYLAAPATEIKQMAEHIGNIMLNFGLISRSLNVDDVFIDDFLPGDDK